MTSSMCFLSFWLLKIELHSSILRAVLIDSSRRIRFLLFSWIVRSNIHFLSILSFCSLMNFWEGGFPLSFRIISCWLIIPSSSFNSHLALYCLLARAFLSEMSLFNCLIFIMYLFFGFVFVFASGIVWFCVFDFKT